MSSFTVDQLAEIKQIIAEERDRTVQYLKHETMDPEDVAKKVAELRAEAAEL